MNITNVNCTNQNGVLSSTCPVPYLNHNIIPNNFNGNYHTNENYKNYLNNYCPCFNNSFHNGQQNRCGHLNNKENNDVNLRNKNDMSCHHYNDNNIIIKPNILNSNIQNIEYNHSNNNINNKVNNQQGWFNHNVSCLNCAKNNNNINSYYCNASNIPKFIQNDTIYDCNNGDNNHFINYQNTINCNNIIPVYKDDNSHIAKTNNIFHNDYNMNSNNNSCNNNNNNNHNTNKIFFSDTHCNNDFNNSNGFAVKNIPQYASKIDNHCIFCGKIFEGHFNLRLHLKNHLNDKSFNFTDFEKPFNCEYLLNIHEKSLLQQRQQMQNWYEDIKKWPVQCPQYKTNCNCNLPPIHDHNNSTNNTVPKIFSECFIPRKQD